LNLAPEDFLTTAHLSAITLTTTATTQWSKSVFGFSLREGVPKDEVVFVIG